MKNSSRPGSIEDLRATFICLTNSANGTIKTADDLTRGKKQVIHLHVRITRYDRN